jgi:DNA repair photolyase
VNYWDYRKQVAKVVPRLSTLFDVKSDSVKMKEKGRKSNYQQFVISNGETEKMERLLNTEHIQSFVEVSLRAQSCPMPLNCDVWDGLKCPYRCRYCFADYFRHSLYTSFFDNSKEIGMRHCDLTEGKRQLDDYLKDQNTPVSGENEVANAFRLGIPLRLGIRFEDFAEAEKKQGISLDLLRYLAQAGYPTMINTKSALPGEDAYVRVLADNKGRAAIHFTLISVDDDLNKMIEPGAPPAKDRLRAAKILSDAGVRVVARIEPWMMFINDSKDATDAYIAQIKAAGIRHMTFDSYSYSANSRGIANNFLKVGIDFDRAFLLSADSQWMSSFMLGQFIQYFRDAGLECSTFDQGNVPSNNDWICCSVGDWFQRGFNWGTGVVAIRYIQSRRPGVTRWRDFETFVLSKGGFLSTRLRHEVRLLWNGRGDSAWPIFWAQGLRPVGNDEDGTIWTWEPEVDVREQLMKEIL